GHVERGRRGKRIGGIEGDEAPEDGRLDPRAARDGELGERDGDERVAGGGGREARREGGGLRIVRPREDEGEEAMARMERRGGGSGALEGVREGRGIVGGVGGGGEHEAGGDGVWVGGGERCGELAGGAGVAEEERARGGFVEADVGSRGAGAGAVDVAGED